MKKALISTLLMMSVCAPALAKAPREAKRAAKREAQKFCKDQGFNGAEFRTCVKEQMKKKKAK